MSYQKKRQQSRLSVKICALLLGFCLTLGLGAGAVYADGEGTNRLQNGSFEEGQTFTNAYLQTSTVANWNTTAFQGKFELFRDNPSTYLTNPNVRLTPTDGTYAAELNADEESTLYQVVKTTPSSVYEWGLDHGARNGKDIMALVIGPKQSADPSKPSKDGRDQFMQMVDWLNSDENPTIKAEIGGIEAGAQPKQYTVYSKKFAASGTFEDNAGNNAFSLTPSTIYTEEWHIWIMASKRGMDTSQPNPWNSYGSNAEGSAGSENESGSTTVDLSKYYLYTVPAGQTETLFGFVSVGYENSPVSGDKAKTYGNFLDGINFQLYHPLSGSTTTHGSAVVGGSDGTTEGEGGSEGHKVTVDDSLATYVTDGEPLKVQAIVKAGDAGAGCEFVGVYYTTQDTYGNSVTKFLQLAGNEIEDTGSLTDTEKAGKWLKSTNSAGDTVYTYYLDNITSATDLHFIFIKNPTITYDPNGGKPYVVDRIYNTGEAENVYSFKPAVLSENTSGVDATTGATSSTSPTERFISPYVSKAAEGQNDGWKFMGWLLTGDTVSNVSSDIIQVNADQLGSLILPAVHTVACDYSVDGASEQRAAQYFKIYGGNVSSTGTLIEENGGVKGVTWTDNGETIAYANVHKGLTLVAQWRWRQAFIPQVGSGTSYTDSDSGGTVEIVGVDASNANYNAAYNANGGKSYHAETDETITATATAKDGFTFEGWYDTSGNLITTNATYSYVETKESVNTYYARFSGNVTQTYIRQAKNGDTWVDTTDDTIGTLGRYTYTDAAGMPISSTATAGEGYYFVGWYDAAGSSVADTMLTNNGATLSYTTTGDATYYARFGVIKYTVTYDLNGGSSSPAISDENIYYHSNVDGTKSTIPVTSALPTKEGHVFAGWELVGSTDTVGASITVDHYSNNTAVVGDVSDGEGGFTLRAKWDPEVTIYYVPIPTEGGSVSCDSETVGTSTGMVSGSTATANEGYYFVGWYDDTDKLVSTNTHYTPEKAAATYYAKFDTTKNVVITVMGNSDSQVYDGTEHSVSGYTVAYTVNGETVSCPDGITLNANDSAEANAVAKGTDVRAEGYTMALSDGDFTVEDTSAEYSYTLVVNPGKLIITPRPITITADSASKVYDGNALTKDSFTYTVPTEEKPNEGLVEGQEIDSVIVAGSQTEIGSSDNVASGAVIKAGDVDVTGNYSISYEKGTLTVTGTESITVTKTPAQTSVTAGSTIVWTVTVSNSGSADAKKLILTDTLDGAVITPPDGVDPANFSVPAGGKVVFTVTYENAKAGTYTNHVEVSRPKDDPDDEKATEKIAEADSEAVSVRDPDTPPVSPGKPVLNTEDHYSYIIGYKDGTVRPYGYITRGEAVTIFFRLLTDEVREEYWCQTNDYSDVPADMWCNNAISTLSNLGIIDGFNDGTFRPYARITRAQFAKMAVGFFETTKEDYQGIFSDVAADAWYTGYVEAAARVGLIEGFNDGTYRPNTNITRAQVCVIINRALGRKPDKEHLLDEDVMVTWVDNTPDDWFYADMQEATNSHDYIWLTEAQEKIEEWTAKLPQRDWAVLEHEWSTAHSAPGGEVTR